MLSPEKSDTAICLHGTQLRFVAVGVQGEESGGIWAFSVQNLPCTSAKGLHVAIQLLRQQAIFNQLYTSCFMQPSKAILEKMCAAEHSHLRMVFEVIEPSVGDKAPAELDLRFFDAKFDQVRCLTFNVRLDGTVTPVFSQLVGKVQDTSNIDKSRLAKLAKQLETCHVVPILLASTFT